MDHGADFLFVAKPYLSHESMTVIVWLLLPSGPVLLPPGDYRCLEWTNARLQRDPLLAFFLSSIGAYPWLSRRH